VYLYPKGITEMKRLIVDPQIKSVHSGYRDQGIGIISLFIKKIIQHLCQFADFFNEIIRFGKRFKVNIADNCFIKFKLFHRVVE